MIQANVAAAETLEAAPSPLIYRIHDAPAPEKLNALVDFLATLGISSPRASDRSPTLQPAAEQTRGGRAEARQRGGAAHPDAGRLRHDNIGHFGLNLAATPTSPRRSAATPT